MRSRRDGTLEEREIEASLGAICNSTMAGGGQRIAPHARLDDGKLDMCIVQAMPLGEFATMLGRMPNGEHADDERVLYPSFLGGAGLIL